jgi:hypothetical protein
MTTADGSGLEKAKPVALTVCKANTRKDHTDFAEAETKRSN